MKKTTKSKDKNDQIFAIFQISIKYITPEKSEAQFYQLFINFFHKNILCTSEVTALLLTPCNIYCQTFCHFLRYR